VTPPWDLYRQREWDAIVRTIGKAYDELERLSELGNPLLKTRLEQAGKRVTIISLAECLAAALDAEQMTIADLSKAEISVGLPAVIEQLAELLSHYQPLDTIVSARLPETSDPLKDVVFITRTGALFPFYRTHALLEQMKGKVTVPSILFYPGELDGAAGLRFMGILDADSNYRPRIF